jgi:colanic acid biosynthesis glycosyl transferase WcaI
MTTPTKPRLLVVTLNFAPELTGIGKFVSEMTAWLDASGTAVRVVCAPPYYPAWIIRPPYSARRYGRERLAGADLWRCPLFVPRQPRALSRLLHLASFAISSLPVVLWQALRWRPQHILVIEPPLACAPGVLLAGLLCGARTWLHVQDFEVDAAFELGLLRSDWLRRSTLSIERWLMRRFDHVSSISPRMVARLQGKGIGASRSAHFPNWVDTAAIQPLAVAGALRATLGIEPDVPVLLYAGNMGEKQGLELLIDTARCQYGRRDALFLLCGDGACRARLQAAAIDLGNVRFLPLQPEATFNELLNLADIHLLPQRADRWP